jgi:4-hydroxybenzoate polyprenyltransferase
MKKYFDIYFFRAEHWYYYLGFLLLGSSIKKIWDLTLLKNLLLGGFLLAYAYSLNDYYDQQQRKKLFIIPLILSTFILPFFNFYQILLSLAFILIVTIYSVEPLRLKTKPCISSLLNGFGFISLFFIGYSTTFSFTFSGLLFGLLLFLYEMVAQLIHEIVDFKDDLKNRIMTTAVFIGKENTANICKLIIFSTSVISLILLSLKIISSFSFFSTLVFMVFNLYQITYKSDVKVRERYRNSGIILGLIYLFDFITF